jgi:gluconolactonase
VHPQRLATGYALAEAPRPDGAGGVYFSDVVGGGVFHLTAAGAIEVVVAKRRRVNGIALHADGGIVITGRDVSHVREGESKVLIQQEGCVFGDLCCDERGRVITSATRADPVDAGRLTGEALRLSRNAEAHVFDRGVFIPNGVGLSPSGDALYLVDSARRVVFAYACDRDGAFGERSVLVDLSRSEPPDFGYPPALPTPDGLAVDELGGVWIAVAGGGCVQRWTPDGVLDFAIDLPARKVTSLAFGGSDRRDLYVTTADDPRDATVRGSVFLVRAPVAGCPERFARV